MSTSFIPIRGAGHGFEGADAERVFAGLISGSSSISACNPRRTRRRGAARDGGAELRAAEELREQQRRARIAELHQRFLDGAVFVMPCGGSGTSNSLGTVVTPGAGTVYFNPHRLSGRCGSTLAAENGVLVAPDGGSQRLPAPAATMRRSPETGGRSRRRRDGLFAKEHGGETTKLCAGSRDVCSHKQRRTESYRATHGYGPGPTAPANL